MMDIGRLCMKIAGRDAGKKCVIVDKMDDRFVLIDGETRRRKCNPSHLEPLQQTIKIKKNASHEDIVSAFKDIGLEARTTKPKTAEKAAKSAKPQKKVRKVPVRKKVVKKK
ncbi:50S ribosomal protein L14e [Candidatus Woesearchaeota archaeon]|nr:50S ribosomal protein L14e [Candidatus Woesearchaeota archaeon]